MKKFLILLVALAIVIPQAAYSVNRYKTKDYEDFGVILRLADPTGSVYQQDEEVRLTIETGSDAYVVVFDIDTEGFIHLLYPREDESVRKFFARRPYEIPEDPEESLLISGKTGMEFIFAVAVPNRDAISERQISFLLDDETQPPARRFRIDGDPFLAANRIAEQLVRGIKYSDEISLAYTYFYVNKAVDYPRYLCEDCYRTGEDPYEKDMPSWVATNVFDQEDRLSYPLPAGFAIQYSDNLNRPYGYDDDLDVPESTTSRVYVTYYPQWYTGFYGMPLLYDPWYYPTRWGVGWGYGAGFYFGVGWNWGWNSWWHCRPPYYYPYYPRGGHVYRDDLYDHRSLRPGSRYRHKGGSTLHTAMNQQSEKDRALRAKTRRSVNSTKTAANGSFQSQSLRKVDRTSRSKTRPVSAVYRPDGFRSRTKTGYTNDRQVYRPRTNKSSKRAYRTRLPARSRPSSQKVRQVNQHRSFKRNPSSSFIKNRSSSARSPKIRGSNSRSKSYTGGNRTSNRTSSRSKGGSSRRR